MTFAHRALASLSRRVDRPELLATFYPGARRLLHEEIAVEAVLAAVLRDDATYVDVGANRGQLLRVALRAAPAGRHVAFEPIPELADELRREFPLLDSRQLALSDQPGAAEFCHFRTMDGWSGLRRSLEVSDERGAPEYIDVRVSTLDAELGELRPDVIKIDVEGAELEVVRGGGLVHGQRAGNLRRGDRDERAGGLLQQRRVGQRSGAMHDAAQRPRGGQ